MAFKLVDRAAHSVSSAPGTGVITLGAATSGYQTFQQAGINNGDTFPYLINDTGPVWEYGIATYSSTGGGQINRAPTKTSAQNTNPLNLSSKAVISATLRAEDIVTATPARLDSLLDVNINEATMNDDDTLLWDVTTGKFISGAGGGGGDDALADLTDVHITSPADDQVLAYISSATKWENKTLATVAFSGAYSALSGAPTIPTNSSFDLSNLGDVSITSLSADEVLVWNGSHWVNEAQSGGGGGSALAILNNGTAVDSAAVSLNFINATSITVASHDVTITLPTGGGGGTAGINFAQYELGAFSPPQASWFTNNSYSGVTATATNVTNQGLSIYATGLASDNEINVLYTKAATGWTTPWAVTARIVPSQQTGQYPGFGIIIQDSAGKCATLQVVGNSGIAKIALDYWASPTSYNSAGFADQIALPPYWLRVRCDGTNYYFGFSYDGIVWTEKSESVTAYLGTLAHVGIGGTMWAGNGDFDVSTGGLLCTYYTDPDHVLNSGNGSGAGFPFYSPPKAAWFDTSTSANTTTVTDVASVGMVMRAAVNTSSEVLEFARVSTSGWPVPWKVTARLRMSADIYNGYAGLGLEMHDSTYGRLMGMEFRALGSGNLIYASAEQWSSPTSHYGSAVQDELQGAGIPEWYQLGWDGTNYTLAYSRNGQDFSVYSTTAFLSAAPDYVGIGIHNYFNTIGHWVPTNVSVTCDYWDDPTHPAQNQNGSAAGGVSPPTIVQQSAFTQGDAPYVLASAPTEGNLLIALVSHNSTSTLGTGWTQLYYSNASQDYASIFMKVAGASETTSQTPSTGNNGSGVLIAELSGAAYAQPALVGSIVDHSSASQGISIYAPANSLLLGMTTSTSNSGLPTSITGATAGPTAQASSGSGVAYPRSTAGFYKSVTTSAGQTVAVTMAGSQDCNDLVVVIQGTGTV